MKGYPVPHIKLMLMLGAPVALLTAYIYFHASEETFLVYLLALSLWAALLGYCGWMRDKQSDKREPVIRRS